MVPRTNYRVNVVVNVKNKKHIQELINRLEKLKTTVDKKPMEALGKQANKTNIEMRKFGRTAQNVSFQLQDVIVQTSNGTDVFRSLGQQLPQMLIGFGAWGAAIGVVAAALPLMVDAFTEAEAEAVSLDDALAGLSVTLESFSMDGYIEQYVNATEAQRVFLRQLLQVRLETAKTAQAATGGALTGAIDSSGGFASTPSAMGLPVDVFARNIQLIQEFNESGGENVELLQQMRDVYAEAGSSLTAVGVQYQTNLFKMETALEQTADAQEALNKVTESGSLLRLTPEGGAQAALVEANIKWFEDEAKAYLDAKKAAEPILRQVVANTGTPAAQAAIKAREEALKAQEEALKAQQQAYAALYPEMARYIQQMEKLILLEEAGAISKDEYASKSEEALEKLNGKTFDLATHAVELFDSSFTTMLDGVLQGTQSIEEGFKAMAKTIIAEMLRIAALQAIVGAFGGDSGIGKIASGMLNKNADGNVFSKGNVVPFANGGVVSSPTLFPMANGTGLMGEKGPEAIVPLNRGPGGKLGVGASPVNLTVNNMASGVEVKARQTNNGLTLDVVMAQVAGAVRSGGNDLTSALEDSYTLGRGGAAY